MSISGCERSVESNYSRLLIKNILEHPKEFKWSTQGLGMLRIYLAPNVRLHVWDQSLRIPDVSPVHTHPWHFRSVVIAGEMHNRRYVEASSGATWTRARLKCGEQACLVEAPQEVFLQEQSLESYQEGHSYFQTCNEIHWSLPVDSTVTLVTRVFQPDKDHAVVYWRGAGGWVDAKPRPSTPDEIAAVTKRALDRWFS